MKFSKLEQNIYSSGVVFSTTEGNKEGGGGGGAGGGAAVLGAWREVHMMSCPRSRSLPLCLSLARARCLCLSPFLALCLSISHSLLHTLPPSLYLSLRSLSLSHSRAQEQVPGVGARDGRWRSRRALVLETGARRSKP